MPRSSQAAPAEERVIIIANPTAGLSAARMSRTRLLEAVARDLEKGGLKTELILETNGAKVSHHAARAARSGCGRIVAAGGDGTVNGVVNGLMRAARANPQSVDLSRIQLGVVPLGTGNVFAFNMDIPKDWRQACRVIGAGNTRRIDVGLARSFSHSKTEDSKPKAERYFLLMAGIGFDAKVVEETSLRLKYVLRDFAYVLKTLQNVVLHQGTQITLQFGDGRLYANESWLVMVGNAASYAWDIKVTTHARLDDGMLDVCLMPFENKLVSIQQAMQILTGQHIERGIAHYWKTQGVRVESEPPVPVQLDGDEWAQTPVELSILPGALQVLAPPETV